MAEFEEFQESELIFSDHNNSYIDFQEMIVSPTQGRFLTTNNKSITNNKTIRSNKIKKKNICTSLPINVPQNFFQFGEKDVIQDDDDDENDDDGELVPPHVIVGRRIAGKMAFSVCTGNGRTLKGRDLSQVRNSILRMTGFLET